MRHPLTDVPATWPPAYPRHEPVTSDEARALDRQAADTFNIPSVLLMEHASAGVAAVAARMALGTGRLVVLCAPGNNGGDGYGAARFLASWGLPLRVLRCAPSAVASGGAGFEQRLFAADGTIEDAWAGPERVSEALREAEVAVDALFGVGLTRALEGPYPDWIRDLNAAPVLRLAVDVPSGLDADNGATRPVAVRADVTATMGLPKGGLLAAGGGAEHAGQVVEIDIGLPGPLHRPHRLLHA
ncbi:MAG: NAD(P)H-hydrate epimerase [Planctomycetota bacterium]